MCEHEFFIVEGIIPYKMGIIKSRNQLNQKKLNELFKSRGYGVINPLFYEKCNDIFDGRDENSVIFQCKCGQVFFLKKEDVDKAIKFAGSDEVPCKKCGDIFDKVLTGTTIDFIKMHNFGKILDLTESSEGDFQKAIEEINKVDKELVNAKHPHELFYQIHNLNNIFFQNFDQESPYIKLIDEILDKAKSNNKEFKKFIANNLVYPQEEKNTSLVEIQNEHYKILKEQAKFYGLDLPFYYGAKEKELELNSDLNAYQHLLEEKRILDGLLNLVRISEGLEFVDNPFQKESISENGKIRKVKGLKDKIMSFKNYNLGKPMNLMLEQLYKTRLRNAHAHNEYQIMLNEGKIKFKESIEINKFYELNKGITEFKVTLGIRMLDTYFSEFPVIRNVKLGFDEPKIVNEELLPETEKTLAEIHIEGYGFTKNNLPKVILVVKNKEILILTPISADGVATGDWEKKWLKQIYLNGDIFNVSFHNIVNLNSGLERNGEIIPILDTSEILEYKCKISKEELKRIK